VNTVLIASSEGSTLFALVRKARAYKQTINGQSMSTRSGSRRAMMYQNADDDGEDFDYGGFTVQVISLADSGCSDSAGDDGEEYFYRNGAASKSRTVAWAVILIMSTSKCDIAARRMMTKE
jgi:hypothetical protein